MLTVYVGKVLDQKRFEYDQLPESSREKARLAVLEQERKGLLRDIRKNLSVSKSNINSLVNDKYHISKLVHHKTFINSLSNVVKLEKHILGNLCHFLEDGTYITYMKELE